MKLVENSDGIVIRHIPMKKWITGGTAIFIFTFLAVWYIYSVLSGSNNFFVTGINYLFETPLLFVFAAFVFVIFGFGIFSIISAPLTTVIVSGKTKSVDILDQRFYGSKMRRFYFYQIEKFKSYKHTTRFSSQYFLALVLANRRTVKLKIPVGSEKQNTTKFIKKINKFIKSKNFQLTAENKQLS